MNNLAMRNTFAAILTFSLLLNACQSKQAASVLPPTITKTVPPSQTATVTLTPTKTPRPTRTPRPTHTPKPSPTLPVIDPLSCIPSDAPRISGIVTHVRDGDTIEVYIDHQTWVIRYLGIDTPETVKPDTPPQRMGKEASHRNQDLVSGQRVTLIADPNADNQDYYGRLLRYVVVNDVFVNYQLVREGLAFYYSSDFSCGSAFFQAYQQAHVDQIGLWAPNTNP